MKNIFEPVTWSSFSPSAVTNDGASADTSQLSNLRKTRTKKKLYVKNCVISNRFPNVYLPIDSRSVNVDVLQKDGIHSRSGKLCFPEKEYREKEPNKNVTKLEFS